MAGTGGSNSLELARAAELRTVGVDELSDIRYIHAAALRLQAGAKLSDAEVAAFRDHVYSQAYTDTLFRQKLIGAYLDRQLIGTAGWKVGDDSGATVRIGALFVRPLFTGLGVGRRLLAAVEDDARTAGFTAFSVRATLNAVAFFESHGYAVTSHGVRNLGPEANMAVAFMRKTGAGTATDGLKWAATQH